MPQIWLMTAIIYSYAFYLYFNYVPNDLSTDYFTITEIAVDVWNVHYNAIDQDFEVSAYGTTDLPYNQITYFVVENEGNYEISKKNHRPAGWRDEDYWNQFRIEPTSEERYYSFKQVNPPHPNPNLDYTIAGWGLLDAVILFYNNTQEGSIPPHIPNDIKTKSDIVIVRGDGDYHPNKNGKANSPLDQFFIRSYMTLLIIVLGNLKLSLTNMGFYLTLAAFISSTYNIIVTTFRGLISNVWSSSQESIYATIHSIVINQINALKGQSYFPFIYVLFVFILTSNLIGMIPYSFSTTSHFIMTFFISFTVVVGSTFLGFGLHYLRFLSILVPSGCPLLLLPLLVLIETISYLARNVSLGLRLAANVLSGHMLLNILSGFVYNIMKSGLVFLFISFLPLFFIMAFSALEIGISFIQAQVFSVLSGSYIKDGLDLH